MKPLAAERRVSAREDVEGLDAATGAESIHIFLRGYPQGRAVP